MLSLRDVDRKKHGLLSNIPALYGARLVLLKAPKNK